VKVDLNEVRAQLGAVGPADRGAWERIGARLLETVGESTYEIWLAQLELIAVDRDGRLVLDTPQETRSWVHDRFGRQLERCAADGGRSVRFAEERERLAVKPRPGDAALTAVADRADGRGAGPVAGPATRRRAPSKRRRDRAGSAGRSADGPPRQPADAPSHTHVHKQTKEVSG
jgi:hypothetical protein